MGLKHLPVTVLAVCVVSVGGTGFAEEGPPRDPPPDSITEAECDLAFPFDCNEECKEYARCLADEPSGDSLAPLACWKELDKFSLCEFGLTLPVPPPLPPPEGQHCHGSDCHDDHVCGDDEIGGGEDCEPCGEVPNQDKTVCLEACGQAATNEAATLALGGIAKAPREQGAALYCNGNEVHRTGWSYSPGDNACTVDFSNNYGIDHSCWEGGSKETGCNLSRVHTHPFFRYPADAEAKCHGTRISSGWTAWLSNIGGMDFSRADLEVAFGYKVMGHLGVSNRSCTRVYDYPTRTNRVLDGDCKDPKPPVSP